MGVLGWAVLGQTPLGAVGAPSGSGGAVLGYAVLGHMVLGQSGSSTPATGGIVSLAEVKTHLNIDAGVVRYDDELAVLLDDALGILEAETGRPLAVRSLVQSEPCPDLPRVVLDAVPCPCVTCRAHVSMTVTGVGVGGVPVDVVDWRLDGPVVSWRAGAGGSAATYATASVIVTYTAGYATTPPWLRLAVLRLVEHLWQKTQQAPHPALGQVGGGYDESQPSPLSYLLPYQVASLIDRHRVLV